MILAPLLWFVVATQQPDLTKPPAAALPTTFAKTFAGRLGGKYEIRMQLDRKGDRLTGKYSYANVENSLLGLTGTIDAAGAFTLDEFAAGKRTGVFRGRLTRQQETGGTLLKLAGTWASVDGRRTLPFEIPEEHLIVDGTIVVYSTAALTDKDDKRGYEIDIAYPQFETSRPGIVEKLNAAIETLAMADAAEFRKQAEEWKKDMKPASANPGEPAPVSDLDVGYEVLAAAHGIVSIRFATFRYYPGAAHPSHDHAVFNYNVREGRSLQLEELFAPRANYLKVLSDYCIEELGLEDDSRRGAEPKKKNYTLWNVTAEGIRITFEEYQVGPYVAGTPDVLIPWRELAGVLRKNGPAAPFAKR